MSSCELLPSEIAWKRIPFSLTPLYSLPNTDHWDLTHKSFQRTVSVRAGAGVDLQGAAGDGGHVTAGAAAGLLGWGHGVVRGVVPVTEHTVSGVGRIGNCNKQETRQEGQIKNQKLGQGFPDGNV